MEAVSYDFEQSAVPQAFLMSVEDNKNIPGWVALERFLRDELDIRHDRAIDTFRKFYNHYLKRFPVHYFTEASIPEVDFALFFPVKVQVNGRKNGHYLVAVSQKNKHLIIFHKNIWSNIKTRENFHRVTQKWMNKGFANQKVAGYDIEEILRICERPEDLIALREGRFSRFLERLERKLHKMKLDRYFHNKWDAIRNFIEERDRQHLQFVAHRLKTKHLSLEAAQKVAKVSKNNLPIYNWIVHPTDAVKVRNRSQVAEYFPWLAEALAQDSTAADYKDIERVIDEGEPLIDALAEFFACEGGAPLKQSTVRKMLNIHLSGEILKKPALSSILQGMDRFLNFLNTDAETIKNLDYYAGNMRNICGFLQTDFYEIFSSLSETQRQALLEGNRRDIARQYENTRDFLTEVYRKLVLAYFVREAHKAGHAGLNELVRQYIKGNIEQGSFIQRNKSQEVHPPYLRPFGNISLPNIVKLSEKWHNQQASYRHRSATLHLTADLRWPVLVYEAKSPDGISFVALNSKSDFKREHEEMGHCIDTYEPHCLGLKVERGAPISYSHIFKVESQNKKARATLEILEGRDENGGRIVSFGHMEYRRTIHQVENNVPEDSREHRAAQWFVEQINSHKMKVDWDKIDRERANIDMGKHMDALAFEVGFDARDPQKCEEAYRKLQAFLPERSRYQSYEEWVQKMGFSAEAKRFFERGKRPLEYKDLLLPV